MPAENLMILVNLTGKGIPTAVSLLNTYRQRMPRYKNAADLIKVGIFSLSKVDNRHVPPIHKYNVVLYLFLYNQFVQNVNKYHK